MDSKLAISMYLLLSATIRKTKLIVLFMFGPLCLLSSQNARIFFNTGEEFMLNNKFEDAINQYSKAIDLEPDFAKAYMQRASAYEKLEMFEKALIDFDRASVFLPKKFEPVFNTGRLFYKLENYTMALEKIDRAIHLKRKSIEAKALKVKILAKLGNYKQAKPLSLSVIKEMPTAENLYFRGEILKNLGEDYEAKVLYIQAYTVDPAFMDAYLALATLRFDNKNYEKAIITCNEALKMDPGNNPMVLLKSRSLASLKEYEKAIATLSIAMEANKADSTLKLYRGYYYAENNQFDKAIADFSAILNNNPKNDKALIKRATLYEKTGNINAAIADYTKFLDLHQNNTSLENEIYEAEQQLFELKREQNKPVIHLTDPFPKNDLVIELPKSKKQITLKGYVTDDNNIDYIKINGKDIPFVKEDQSYAFFTSLDVEDNELITITVADIYKNVQISNYSINWTEINPPEVEIIAPYATEEGMINLDHNKPMLYVEGKITDESLIQNVLVDGVSANFRAEDYNPVFSANINITDKNSFAVRAIDAHGNEVIKEFTFNRLTDDMLQNNPMGKTWAVFIENTNYRYFPSLAGPANDIDLMKTALGKYEIHNFIHKKDMTKQEMEKFFSIELRDLVRSNNVNAVMIWYAGHGTLLNQTGYWIPTDALPDQEFSYFNTNALRASLQSYTKYVTHILVVTDACHTGPAFYLDMPSPKPKQVTCDNWQAAKLKSAQIVTSSGYELAVETSEFTLHFANALTNNTNSCIPIDQVVNQVKKAVQGNKQLKPTFGKIVGLENDDGTFFFIAK